MVTSKNTALSISNLVYEYPFNFFEPKGKGLTSFSLEVLEGEAFGFLGANGAGKTTTIKCILNLVNAKSGSIKIFGTSVDDPLSRRVLGYLPEVPYFYENLTAYETLEHAGELLGLSALEISSKIDSWSSALNIRERLSEKMKKLSKGLMQRVALIQSLLGDPKLLILDEPFSGLDPIGRREFRDIFFDLKKKGVTLFMSSHILSDVEQLCDRVSVMTKGELKGVYSVEELKNAGQEGVFLLRVRGAGANTLLAGGVARGPQVVEYQLENEADAQRGLSKALAANLHVVSFERKESPLEELFLKVVGG
jgi:ABC-2 type transport system ATP-binding protein